MDHGEFAWASLDNFWCVNGEYLARQDKDNSDFNKVLGRDERKTCMSCGSVHDPPMKCPKTKWHPKRYSESLISRNPTDQWIAGDKQKSKKVFSFKNPKRTFGFLNPGVIGLPEMKRRLNVAWPSLKSDEFLHGPEILKIIIGSSGGAP
jgi:CRISPR-associated protein Cmr1